VLVDCLDVQALFREDAALAAPAIFRRGLVRRLLQHLVQSLAPDYSRLWLSVLGVGRIVGRGLLAIAAEIELNKALHGLILRLHSAPKFLQWADKILRS